MSKTFKMVDLSGSSSFVGGNMDIVISSKGVPALLEGVDTVAQSFEKGLLTAPGSNILDTAYGTRAWDLIGAKMLNNITVGLLATIAEELLRWLASSQQAIIGEVDIPPEEQIEGLQEIAVTFQQTGKLVVEATVKTRTDTVETMQVFEGGTPNV